MAISQRLFYQLKKITGSDHISKEHEDLVCYSYDATGQTYLPDVVVFPADSQEVSGILRIAHEKKIPVVPRGSGSGMSGGSLAVKGGIMMNMNRFNRIIQVDRNNFTADVEPGVITGEFHKYVEKQGLFYPPDPASSAFCSLGGNLSECAGGPRAVKYGVTKDYVLGLSAVLPNGDIIRTGVRTAKGVAGYDFTKLIVGSEGTLAVITQMILKLLPLPDKVGTMMAVFHRMSDAACAVSSIIASGLIPRTVEYLDNGAICCAESYAQAGFPVEAGALLIIEVDGTRDQVSHDLKRLNQMCTDLNSSDIKVAENKQEADQIWKVRKAVSPSLYHFGPNKLNEDIVVPISKIPDMVQFIEESAKTSGLKIVTFGHAGDGNIHVNVMYDKQIKQQRLMAEAITEKIFIKTIELGGTITGEHGVGISKQKYIGNELGKTEIQLMKDIKKVFDPNNILNPGKIFNHDWV